ncbi:diacylglycerol/lipid kinase family protein [Halobacillus litoralis]|uniref:DAGKc domain-containing protein n=1 Tax=Halobacillus litoralis TaxID=45668 RepID=A0A410MGN5_9BACI|nr:diacylglycerol kinase family protein [Halobacillus litoralis]QAS53897.1 hypothetical protein HLI_17630 [Halobacillus litoralis]
MYIVIVNPEAGHGRSIRLFRKIQKDPLYKKANCRTFFTEGPGHAEKIAEQVAEIHHENLSSVIVIGGDGTLHEVINGMKQYPDVPVTFLPAGSGNDFGRGIGLKTRGVKLFRKIISHPLNYRVYLGSYVLHQRYKYGKRTFLNSIGFGLDGHIVTLVNESNHRHWIRKFHLSNFTYPIALLRAIKNMKPIHFELEIDGHTHPVTEGMMVTISNHPYYGGGMRIAPKASLQSSNLQVMIVRQISKKKLLALFLSVFIGKHTQIREVEEIKAHSVIFRSKEMVPFQVDGQGGRCCECHVKKASTKATIFKD